MARIWALFVWAIFGLVAAALARFLVPGRQPMSWLATIFLGVAGSFVGGFIGYFLFGGEMVQASGFILSVLGAVIALSIYLYSKRSETTVD